MKLIAQALGRAAFACDWSQTQLMHEAAEFRAEVELGASGAQGLGVQPSQNETGVGSVGQASRAWCAHIESDTTVDALELMVPRTTVGESRLNEESRHEAQGTGRSSIEDVGAENRRRGAPKIARPGI